MSHEEDVERLRNPRIHMCEHMRLVAFAIDGLDGRGWYHIGSEGVLESAAPACAAGVCRFNVRLPENAMAVGNALRSDENGVYHPFGKTLNEQRV